MRLSSTGVRLAFALVGIAAVAVMATASAFGGSADKSVYIVEMKDSPAVAYAGGIPGLKATKPSQGEKINPKSGDVVKYADYLRAQHDKVLVAAGGADKLYDYTYTYNGFSARLSDSQAALLKKRDDVAAVTPNELVTSDTATTPKFLGLDATGGLWSQLGGPTGGKSGAGAGEGVIIGIVDSGIWPESKSFADRDAAGKLIFQQIPGWHGKCTPGESFNASMCNQKLIGGQHFNAAWGGDAGVESVRPWEFQSVRDYQGHGTHTASTAGGNFGVPATGAASVFGTANGIAPRARIASYKALWSTQDGSTASGFTADLVAAIDQAVADGVDVINYSISGSSTNFADPAEIAFLFAADAGVFVAASAGNSGPASATVAHPSPWITTVAAGTHPRAGAGTAVVDGVTYTGAAQAAPLVSGALVDSGNVGLTPGLLAAKRCFLGALNPLLVAGKIVLCDRGTTARIEKSFEVLRAGGIGMILVNPPGAPGSLNADLHFVPTVHVQNDSYDALHAAAGSGTKAASVVGSLIPNAPAPFTASFSSRGPLQAGGGDLLKPDVIAPGNDILAAVSPVGNRGRDFDLYSGTSMSSPHVAGLAALLADLHPDWSPMAIKSALMTSAYDVLDGPNANPSVIFSQGAGHVKPNSAANPGLVYDSGFDDWRGFLRSQRLCTFCFGTAPAPVFDPSDLNTASIAIGDLAGTQTVTRRVTNVGSAAATYNAAVSVAGINAVVSPSTLTLNPGQTKSFTVAFTTTTATPNTYTGGYLAWSDGSQAVRIPIVIRPVALAAPASVLSSGAAISYPVTFGYSGAFTATARGLVAAVVAPGTVADDPTDSTCSLVSPNAQLSSVAVSAGTTYARFSLFDADVNAGSDIDLCVFSGSTLVGSSGSGTSAEEVNLLNPAAGNYTVVVQGWGVVGSSPFKLHTWLLDSAAAGNMTVTAPATATIGGTGTINLAFFGLTAGTKYLGSVAYGGSAGMPNPTIVRVSP